MMIKRRKEKAISALRSFGVALFWLAIWWLLALAVDKAFLLPAPAEVGERFIALIFTGEFWQATLLSLLRIVTGFVLGMASGIALAVMMYKSRIVYILLAPFIKAVRATPVVSFIILALVWIAGGRLPVFISFLMVLPVAWANTLGGIESTDKQLLEMAALFKVKPRRIVSRVYLPSLKPYLVAAATTGLGLAWKSGITAEVLSTPRLAIGSELQTAKIYLETADMFVWTIVVIILSLLLERLLLHLVKRGSGA
jgi:NitT/TauT family transport system permease protein